MNPAAGSIRGSRVVTTSATRTQTTPRGREEAEVRQAVARFHQAESTGSASG